MEENKNQELIQFIVAKIGHEQYGVNIQFVHNIERMLKVTRVPKAPYYIKGVINLRGDIIPVMSLRLKFGLEPDEYTNNTRIIIVKLDGNPMGLIVDEVKEVINLTEEDIEKISKDSNDEKSNYVQGVGKIGKELVTLLNIDGLINTND
ncbi:chemotaxis protein CheW [Vallitalea guaymasensis]|uniref:Chemotaxis protein CheW n=1 Tax=Vallitalea guaymasensis TaxID=1185412 RepID=A0A8J8SE21_9FIRM|nr:chemotaxis protein CheW [Vallitalea guaymasensis]QUH31463.1 chemotaxis protein CheW [Vallitalea guaymasensis]